MAHLIGMFKVSQRRACTVIGQHRSTQRHISPSTTPEDPDAALRAWLRAYAGKHPRWGYRRAHADLHKQGWTVNRKKVQRLWRAEGLRVPVRKRRKRAGASTAGPIVVADVANAVWAL